jgi:hypothetical protein
MLSVFDDRPDCSRREFLRIGSLGLGGLCLSQLFGTRALAAPERSVATGKSVIFLFQFGGPSQFETFDPKMAAPEGVRSVTGEIATALPGVTFGSSFPQLARRAHKLAIVRSYVPGREISNHLIHPLVHPRETLGANLGSLYSRMAGMTHHVTGLPTNAALFPRSVDERCPPTRMDFGNFLATGDVGSAFAPFVPGASSTLLENMRLNVAPDRLEERQQMLAQFNSLSRRLDETDDLERLQAQAFDVILRGAADAFDLSRECPRVLARYDTAPLLQVESVDRRWRESYPRYLEHAQTVGKLLLLARRLCERGCGFVMVNTGFVWDMHGVDGVHAGVEEGMRYVAPPLDHAVSAFLDDVEARGLSEQILLVMCGEMGRTPRISQLGGRDHWGNLGPLVLAGGGLRMGQVVGRSTANGGEPADSPIQRRNLLSTIWHTLLDVGALRLRTDPVARLMTENEPIRQLLS